MIMSRYPLDIQAHPADSHGLADGMRIFLQSVLTNMRVMNIK